MTEWYQPDVFIVQGMPQNGKSQFAINYSRTVSNCQIVHADELFRICCPGVEDIFNYVNSSEFNSSSFLELVKTEILKVIRAYNYTKTILIEGYFCTKFSIEIAKICYELNLTNVYNVDMQKTTDTTYLCLFDGFVAGFSENYNYYQIAKNIDDYLKTKQNIEKRTTYQRFPWITETQLNSNSDIKYNISFKNDNLFNKSFLDIGCNTGIFCFKAKQDGAKLVYGIDNNIVWLELAYSVNKYFYNLGDIHFVEGNATDYDFKMTFDYAFCASVFHYFKEKQELFINKIHSIMNTDGVFYIEVELYPDESVDDAYVKRGADTNPLRYPSHSGFLKMILNKFIVERKELSYKQPGCLYDRYMYKLRKI